MFLGSAALLLLGVRLVPLRCAAASDGAAGFVGGRLCRGPAQRRAEGAARPGRAALAPARTGRAGVRGNVATTLDIRASMWAFPKIGTWGMKMRGVDLRIALSKSPCTCD